MPAIPSSAAFLSVLTPRRCSRRSALHARTSVRSHFPSHRLLCDSLVLSLAKHGAIHESLQLLASSLQDGLKLSTFSWTCLISACAGCDRASQAPQLYRLMLTHAAAGVAPDRYTFLALFKACAKAMDLEQGKRFHDDARPLLSDVFVCNGLISMYGKCGACHEAEKVFAAMPSRTAVSWNAMLTAYLERQQGKQALMLYRQMKEEGRVKESLLTMVIVLQACCVLVEDTEEEAGDVEAKHAVSLEIGSALHAQAYGMGYASDVMLGSTLISMYGKCQCLSGAVNAFNHLPVHNVVTWTAMISVCVEHGRSHGALQLFKHMHTEGVEPNHLSYALALRACTAIAENREGVSAALSIGQALHKDAQLHGHSSDTLVSNKLIAMYGKCKAVLEAEQVFHRMPQRDVFTWNAMLALYAEQRNQGEKALHLYRRMLREHMEIDDVSVMCILQACGTVGNLEVCQDVHSCIVAAGYDGVPPVMASLIHAYGGCGSAADGHDVFDGLAKADIVLWNACIQRHAEEGNQLECFKVVKELILTRNECDEVTQSSVLSAFCHTGFVPECLEYFSSFTTREPYILPDIRHYGIMFDLLGRAGDFVKAESMLQQMPMQADMIIWSSLLGACCNHGNLEFAKELFDGRYRSLHEPLTNSTSFHAPTDATLSNAMDVY